ncbi:MAG: MerR family transcriptional regulator [Ignavibacteriae bacterium]|jgi:DNA-binding transcriptional MerR regulator/methylmalonyl-CoA mutase cobalamin-binding subunit|nr:MerR family transcriptional regulator [Ignavibacteriota bacterium]NOG99209.1 MerR family transcriptional regulator [Ignavibacteriota bacterium]
MKNENKYPIKAVAQKTGLSVHVIRAWEKRYNAVVPNRTETNRRLYSESDIEKLQILLKLTDQGHNIGGIANLSIDELRDLVEDRQEPRMENYKVQREVRQPTDPDKYFTSCLKSVYALDLKELESTLYKASVSFSQPVLLDRIIIPLITHIGDLWKEGEIRVYHEHMVTASLRGFLSNLIDTSKNSESAPKILATTPQGQLHELGALIVSAVASSEGWNVTYLGPNLPAEEIVGAAEQLNCKAIAISIVYPLDDYMLRKELIKFKQILPDNISLLVGGKGARGYLDVLEEIGARVILDIANFKKSLSAIRENKYN